MPLSSQPDPVLIVGDFTFEYFEIPEFIKFGGPFRAVVHKQPGGARQIDSMGPDPGPISWEGIMLTADGWERAQTLYAMYEAGDKVTVIWNAWARDVLITDLKIRYRANNYVEYSIELTEVTVIGAEAVLNPGVGNINDLGDAFNNGNGVINPPFNATA